MEQQQHFDCKEVFLGSYVMPGILHVHLRFGHVGVRGACGVVGQENERSKQGDSTQLLHNVLLFLRAFVAFPRRSRGSVRE